LRQVGSYGKQLGGILDVLKVLVSRRSPGDLTPAERDAHCASSMKLQWPLIAPFPNIEEGAGMVLPAPRLNSSLRVSPLWPSRTRTAIARWWLDSKRPSCPTRALLNGGVRLRR
jgi:hypothetical protein